MTFSAFTAEPTREPGPTATSYSNPTSSDLAAVAATVSAVGVFMAVLITWLAIRLRHTANTQHVPIVTTNAAHVFRPSFAPSEASSKFGFARKSLRLSRKQHQASWDFADPDPVGHPKEHELVRSPSHKHRPPPLVPTPAYIPRARRASTYKDEFGPRTPISPTSPYGIELPPPAYSPETARWPSKAVSPS